MSAERLGVKHVCQIFAIHNPASEGRRLLVRQGGHWFISPEPYHH